jgi:hypothetical protein
MINHLFFYPLYGFEQSDFWQSEWFSIQFIISIHYFFKYILTLIRCWNGDVVLKQFSEIGNILFAFYCCNQPAWVKKIYQDLSSQVRRERERGFKSVSEKSIKWFKILSRYFLRCVHSSKLICFDFVFLFFF